MIKVLFFLLVTTCYAQQQAPPDWQNKALERTAPNALVDADTHQPFSLSDAERAMIVHAMQVMTKTEPEREQAALFQAGFGHIKSGAPLTMGDVIFINGPLMMVQSIEHQVSATNPNGMTEAEISLIKPLLRRMRKAAAAMTAVGNNSFPPPPQMAQSSSPPLPSQNGPPQRDHMPFPPRQTNPDGSTATTDPQGKPIQKPGQLK